ncbi:hypothetical protein KIN20_000981 [Parelaphostrongylus tenuis]|uniref:Uncharacterized protein n=1 Tax=Parelaphostrongylus tenuis TaxID=148309 RepID=A0AAD5MLI1_PARTN|nr:hypothetical protein KIN20_000981 [Parelaphostrongylus tenuis]
MTIATNQKVAIFMRMSTCRNDSAGYQEEVADLMPYHDTSQRSFAATFWCLFALKQRSTVACETKCYKWQQVLNNSGESSRDHYVRS